MDKIHIQKIVREELSHLTEEQKRKILHDLDESKVTPAKVSKAFTKVAEISKLMITNLEKYKSAKSSGDENAIAKHTKIAGDLTKKKKAAESEANSLIAQLDRDVELSLEGIKEIVSEEYDKLTEISKEEKAAQFKLKLFLKKGLKLSVKDGEDKLYDYAEELDRLADDEYNEVVDPLYMAVELVQDAGVPGVNDVEDDKEYRMYIKSADKHMKTFIKNAKKAIGSMKEGKTEDATVEKAIVAMVDSMIKAGKTPGQITKHLKSQVPYKITTNAIRKLINRKEIKPGEWLNEDNKLAKIVDKNLKQGMKKAKFIKLIGKQPIFTAIDKNNKKVDITLTKKGNIQKYADFKKWGADLGQVYGNIKGDVKKLNKFEKRPYYESVGDVYDELDVMLSSWEDMDHPYWQDVQDLQDKIYKKYNLGESKLTENFKKNMIKAKTMKDIKKIYPKAVKPRAIHGAVFYVELEKDLWAKCFSTNSMKSIEPFNVEAIYKMKGKKQTFLWTEGNLNAPSIEKELLKAKKGAKASGGGYGPFIKIASNSWKNKKTGSLSHSKALSRHIGEFDDFIIEGKLNESMIGIQTKANFKPLQLKGALERAGIKGFQMNRLSVTLTALKLDKKYYKEAMKIIDALRLKVMMAKESVNEVRVKKGDAIKMKDGEIGVVNKVKGRVAYIKLDSMPGSFHPIEAAEITYKGKHKGKDLYNEASSIWKALDAKWKLYDESMDIENDLRNITATIKQLHKNMEQEAEPEGGKVADRYGREIEKYEKMYKKRKAEFKKVSAKIDKMEQY